MKNIIYKIGVVMVILHVIMIYCVAYRSQRYECKTIFPHKIINTKVINKS